MRIESSVKRHIKAYRSAKNKAKRRGNREITKVVIFSICVIIGLGLSLIFTIVK